MGMLRWTRWWLMVIVVGGFCFHIVKAAQAPEPKHANFRSVPKLNKDGTRDVDLPVMGRDGYAAFEGGGWLDILGRLAFWQHDVEQAILAAPQFDMGDYQSTPRVRSREGTLSKVTTKGTQNTTFGGLSSQ